MRILFRCSTSISSAADELIKVKNITGVIHKLNKRTLILDVKFKLIVKFTALTINLENKLQFAKAATSTEIELFKQYKNGMAYFENVIEDVTRVNPYAVNKLSSICHYRNSYRKSSVADSNWTCRPPLSKVSPLKK